jgi:hypothetical protein
MRDEKDEDPYIIDIDACGKNMSFQECELTVIRHAVEESESVQKAKINTSGIKKMVAIVEAFLKSKKLVCYGGTAINNVLPKEVQFYDRESEIPDYDFFSSTPLEDSKELADIYHDAGFIDVEAKAGVHYGTFKVFVNYTPMADITYMHPDLFYRIREESITIDDINYCPVNYLRMNMYLELSRPLGDVSRWDKVVRRLFLLNKYHPIKTTTRCRMGEIDAEIIKNDTVDSVNLKKIQLVIQEEMAHLGAVFFGGYAASLYAKYMKDDIATVVSNVVCLDVIYDDLSNARDILKKKLSHLNMGEVTFIEHDEFNDMIPKNIEVRVNNQPVVFVYESIACHNYNVFKKNGLSLNIATIDTMMTFYLAFYYARKTGVSHERIFCMVQFFFELSQKWLTESGVLKRYSTTCYGYQPTLIDIRGLKTKKRNDKTILRGSKEFEMWFLNYKPQEKRKKMEVKAAKNAKALLPKKNKDDKIRKYIVDRNNKSFKKKDYIKKNKSRKRTK